LIRGEGEMEGRNERMEEMAFGMRITGDRIS
jgi:hypothetical protein